MERELTVMTVELYIRAALFVCLLKLIGRDFRSISCERESHCRVRETWIPACDGDRAKNMSLIKCDVKFVKSR